MLNFRLFKVFFAALILTAEPVRAEFQVNFVPIAIFDSETLTITISRRDGIPIGTAEGRGTTFTFDIAADDLVNEIDQAGICFDVRVGPDGNGFVVVETCVEQLAELKQQGSAYIYRASLVPEIEYAATQRSQIRELIRSAGASNRTKIEIIESFESYLNLIGVEAMHPQDIDLFANIVEHFRRFPSFDNVDFISMDFLGNPASIRAIDASDGGVGKLARFIEVSLASENGSSRAAARLSELFVEYQKIDPRPYVSSDLVDSEEEFYKALFGFALTLSGDVGVREDESTILYQGKSPILLYFERCERLARLNEENLSQSCLFAARELQQLVNMQGVEISDARTIASKIGNTLSCGTSDQNLAEGDILLLSAYFDRGNCAETERFCLSAKVCLAPN